MFFSRLFSLFILCVVIGVAAPKTFANPTIWKISDADTNLYIMGTIHLLPSNVEVSDPRIDQLINLSDGFIFELHPSENNPEKMRAIIGKYGFLPADKSLKDVLSAETYARIAAHYKNEEATLTQVGRLQPWYLAMMLTLERYQYEGFRPDRGVENILKAKIAKTGKPIYGLETAEYQISRFAAIDLATQDKMMHGLFDDLPYMGNLIREMVNYWRKGQDVNLGKVINRDMIRYPMVAEQLLYQRNQNWAKQIQSLMDNAGTYFMAVGAGHLAGDKNLIDLLKSKGHSVERNGPVTKAAASGAAPTD